MPSRFGKRWLHLLKDVVVASPGEKPVTDSLIGKSICLTLDSGTHFELRAKCEAFDVLPHPSLLRWITLLERGHIENLGQPLHESILEFAFTRRTGIVVFRSECHVGFRIVALVNEDIRRPQCFTTGLFIAGPRARRWFKRQIHLLESGDEVLRNGIALVSHLVPHHDSRRRQSNSRDTRQEEHLKARLSNRQAWAFLTICTG